MRILIVEDNEGLATGIVRLMNSEAHVTDWVPDAETLQTGLNPAGYDLFIIDLGLPGIGGIDLIRWLRAQGVEAPVLIVTAQDAVKCRVRGLDAGADDYLIKPFEVEELEARVRALLRRRGTPITSSIEFGPLSLDLGARQFSLSGSPLGLAPKEHAILEALIRRAGLTVSKEALLDAAYGFEEEVSPAAVEVVVHRLRRKLEGSRAVIATLRGFGYLLRIQAP